MNVRFMASELRSAFGALGLFALSVAVSILALVSTGGLRDNVTSSLQQQARALIASDMQIRSTHALSASVLNEVAALQSEGVADSAQILEMFSMVSTHRHDRTVLCQIKVVPPSYPWYGSVTLQSGRPLSTVLTAGQVVVDSSCLNRLLLHVGDVVHLGSTELTIADVVRQEPDRPLAFFAVAPRVFVAQADLDRLDLVRPGSSVTYRQVVRLHDPTRLATVADRLRPMVRDDHDQLQTWESAEERLQHFFDALLRFLAAIAVFILILAGFTIQSTLSAFMNQRQTTLATLKALGATHRFLLRHYGAIIALFTVAGLALGVVSGVGVQFALASSMQTLVGPDLHIGWAPVSIGVALLCGAGVTFLATRQPLDALQHVRPHAMFKYATGGPRRLPPVYGLAVVLAAGVLFYEVRSWMTTSVLLASVLGLLGVQAVACTFALRLCRRLQIRPLPWRQALRGLDRPGNQSWLVAVNLATALTVLLTIASVESSIRHDFLIAYPPDSPNVFFVDIQKDQLDAFKQALGVPGEYYPVVRARVESINDRPIAREDNPEYRKGNLDREIRITWRDTLLDSERLVHGATLFVAGQSGAQVSVVQELADEAGLHIGDRIVFTIQGVELPATVSSIREISKEGIRPAFEWVMDPPDLSDAPATWFTAVRIPDVAGMQNRLATAFPNVTSIDVHDVLTTLGQRLGELDAMVRFFSALSLVSGALMLLGSLLSTQARRLQEVVYFQVLGARRGFVLQVVAFEGLILGVLAVALAVMESQLVTYLLCRFALDVDYEVTWPWLLACLVLVPATTAGLGLGASGSLLRQRPAAYLREQEDSGG